MAHGLDIPRDHAGGDPDASLCLKRGCICNEHIAALLTRYEREKPCAFPTNAALPPRLLCDDAARYSARAFNALARAPQTYSPTDGRFMRCRLRRVARLRR